MKEFDRQTSQDLIYRNADYGNAILVDADTTLLPDGIEINITQVPSLDSLNLFPAADVIILGPSAISSDFTELKKNPAYLKTPIIAIAISPSDETVFQADDFIMLPVEAEELTIRIERLRRKKKPDLHILEFVPDFPVAIGIMTGPDYVLEKASKKMLEVLSKTAEEVIGKPIFESMPEARDQGFEEILLKVYQTGETYVGDELPLELFRNGVQETIFIQNSFTPIRNSNNDITGIISIATDITSMVKARKIIEGNEEQISMAVESGEIGMYDYYLQSQRLIWSKRLKDIYGVEEHDEANISIFYERLHPDDRERIINSVEKIFDTGRNDIYNEEFRVVHPRDGKVNWLRSKGKIFRDAEGSPVRLTGITIDISEEKEQHFNLELQSLVLKKMDEGVSVSDDKGIIIFTNQAEDQMFGYQTGELIGMHVSQQNAYDPEQNQLIVGSVISKLQEVGYWSGEWHNIRKDGTEFYTHSYITRVQINSEMYFVCVQRDITEEKRSRETLAFRTALLEAQNEAIPDAILIVDTKGKILTYNKKFVETWNIPDDIVNNRDDDAALNHAMNLLPDPEKFIERIKECYSQPTVKSHDILDFTDGRVIERHGNPVLGEDGSYYGWAWIFRDITAQRTYERELQQIRDQLQLTFDNFPSSIYLVNKDLRIVYLNLRSALQLGYSSIEEVLNIADMSEIRYKIDGEYDILTESGEELLHEDGPTARSLKTGLSTEAVTQMRSKRTGESKWYISKATPLLREGKMEYLLISSTDITEQKHSEQLIRQSEEKFRQLSNMIPQIIWTAGPDGNTDFVNNRWYDYTGSSKMFGEGSLAEVLHPDDVDLCSKSWESSVQNGFPYQIEYRFRSKTGEYRWFLGKALPIRNEAGQITKWFGTCTDIQEQKNLAVELEAKVNSRTRDLRKSNNELQATIAELHQANEQLKHFAHVTSHDLQEPLRKIQTFASRLQEAINNPDLVESYLGKILNSSDRMRMLISDLLEYSHLSNIEKLFTKIDLNMILSDVLGDFEILIEQKQAEINSVVLPRIEAIPLQINQLFYNLIGNALKFSHPDRPPKVEISSRRVTLHDFAKGSGLAAETEYCEIVIRDNGIGFEQKYEEQIFTIFKRLHNKDAYTGTGIGLAISKKIVDNHHGMIFAKSIEGNGAAFHIILPLEQSEKVLKS